MVTAENYKIENFSPYTVYTSIYKKEKFDNDRVEKGY